MNTDAWLAKVSDGAAVNAIAKTAKIAQSTLNAQVNAGALKAEVVIAVARGYKYPAVAALVENGHITDEEARDAVGLAGALDVADALKLADAAQLAYEISERLAALEVLQGPGLGSGEPINLGDAPSRRGSAQA